MFKKTRVGSGSGRARRKIGSGEFLPSTPGPVLEAYRTVVNIMEQPPDDQQTYLLQRFIVLTTHGEDTTDVVSKLGTIGIIPEYLDALSQAIEVVEKFYGPEEIKQIVAKIKGTTEQV